MTEPTPLEAAQKLLISAAIGSCTCNTKSPELIWHAPNCRYVIIMTALENVEVAASSPKEEQGPPHWRTWNGAVLDAGQRQVTGPDILEKLQEDWLRLSRGSFDSVDCGLAANVVQEAIDEITRLRASHAHISEQAAHGWQPIETAPCRPLDKHGYGPTILLWAADALQIGFWDDDFGNFYIETSDRHPKPTHWMPMPSAPVSGSTEGGK